MVVRHAVSMAIQVLRSEDEDVPVTPDDMEIEELDCAVGDSQGIGGPLVHVFSVEEICLEFLFIDLIGVLSMELDEHSHSPCVCLLGSFSLAI